MVGHTPAAAVIGRRGVCDGGALRHELIGNNPFDMYDFLTGVVLAVRPHLLGSWPLARIRTFLYRREPHQDVLYPSASRH
jgi:hypothetical protein